MNTMNDENVKQWLEQIPVPELELDSAIAEGRRRAHLERQQEKRAFWWKGLKYVTTALMVACILGGSLIVGSRWSPVLASSLSQIPFVSYLVEFVAGSSDKGLQDIIENEYYEVIDQTVTVNEVELTVNGVIADEYGLVLFYEVDASRNPYHVDIEQVNIRLNGQPIQAGISYGSLGEEADVVHQIKIESYEQLPYGDKHFELEMSFTDVNHSLITIPFQLKEPIAPSKHYPLQQELIVSGQRIWLKELNISPMRAQLTIEADEGNDMQLLDVGIAELIDEHGESWGKGTNGTIAWGSLRNGDYMINIQSNYFRSPEQLTLRLGQISALPKGEDYIEVDFDEQRVLYQPEQLDIQFQFLPKGIMYSIVEQADKFRGNIISSGIDANGKEVYNHFASTTVSSEELRVQMGFDLEEISNPVRFNINSYPDYLSDEVEVELPLVPSLD